MMNGIIWLAVGGTIGAIINAIMRQCAEPYLMLDVLAGSGGAFVTGLFLALLFGIHSITPHHLNFPVSVASTVGALFSITIVNLVFDAMHSEER